MDTHPIFKLCRVIFLVLVFSLLSNNKGYSGVYHRIDSLVEQLELITVDSAKIKHLFKICEAYRAVELREAALQYAKEIIQLSEVNGFGEWLTEGAFIASGYAFAMGQNEDALFYSTKALEVAKQEKMWLLVPKILNIVGLAHYARGDWNKAMEYFKEALEVDSKIDGDKTTSGYIANNLGGIYVEQGDYTKARECFETMFFASRELNDTIGMSVALTNIGECEYHIGQIETALGYYQEAVDLSESVNDDLGVGYLLSNIGTVYLAKKEFDLATNCFNKSLSIAQRVIDYDGSVRALIGLAQIASQEKHHYRSNSYCKSALGLAEDIGSKPYKKEIYALLANNYEMINDHSSALKYQKLLKSVNDSLFNEIKNRQIAELSITYETDKKEAENKLLIKEQEKDKAIIETHNTVGVLVLLSLILVSLFAFTLYSKNQNKKKYSERLEIKVKERTKQLEALNHRLEKSNKDLEQFAYICSHDLKEPLRNIHGFTTLLNRRLAHSKDNEAREYIDVVQSSVHQMNDLIEGILEYSKIGYDVDLDEDVDLSHLTDRLKVLLRDSIEEKNVMLKTKDVHVFKGNSSLIFLVLKNLVENAIKYNQADQPLIEISSKSVANKYQIEVKDNGIGIEEQYFNQIFTIFKRLHTRNVYKGVGIGLSVCKKIVQNLGGEIWVESQFGKGSRFVFSIPNEQPIRE